MQTVTVDALVAGDTPATTLVPGGSADVIVRASNPNAFAVQVYSFTANGTATADASHPLCTTTGVTFNAPAAPLTPTVVHTGEFLHSDHPAGSRVDVDGLTIQLPRRRIPPSSDDGGPQMNKPKHSAGRGYRQRSTVA